MILAAWDKWKDKYNSETETYQITPEEMAEWNKEFERTLGHLYSKLADVPQEGLFKDSPGSKLRPS